MTAVEVCVSFGDLQFKFMQELLRSDIHDSSHVHLGRPRCDIIIARRAVRFSSVELHESTPRMLAVDFEMISA